MIRIFFVILLLIFLSFFSFGTYPNNLKNWDFDRAKAPGSDLLKRPPYCNMEGVSKVESRELSLRSKTNSSSCLGIEDHLQSESLLLSLFILILALVDHSYVRSLFSLEEWKKQLYFSVAGIFFIYPAVVLLITTLFFFVSGGVEGQLIFKQIQKETLNQKDWLVLVMLIGVIAPIGEELLFRGYFQKNLSNYMRPSFSITIISCIFALAHFIPGMSVAANGVLFVNLFIISCVMGAFFSTFGSLFPSILFHSAYNLISISILFLAEEF